jgi:hypothetical protein
MPPRPGTPARTRSNANLVPGGGAGDRGLQRAAKHGAYAAIAARELSDKVREVYDAISADAPVKDQGTLPAADTVIVRQLAETLVRRERVRESELRHGIEAPDGKLRGVVEFGLRLDGHIAKLCDAIGLTPRSRAALGLELARARNESARALDAELAESRAAWQEHER